MVHTTFVLILKFRVASGRLARGCFIFFAKQFDLQDLLLVCPELLIPCKVLTTQTD